MPDKSLLNFNFTNCTVTGRISCHGPNRSNKPSRRKELEVFEDLLLEANPPEIIFDITALELRLLSHHMPVKEVKRAR